MAFLDEAGLAELWQLINKGELANEYVWSKSTVSGAWFVVEGTTKNWTNNFPSDSNYYRTLYNTAKAVNGEVVLSDAESVFWTDVIGKYFDLNGVKCKITSLEGATSLEYVTLSAVQGTTSEVVGYVNSSESDAYPVDDGYAYTALGKLGEKVQIATGNYTGTGKYGSGNKNSLTFDFVPKVVFIVGGYRNYTAVFVRPDSANDATGSYCIIGENATYLVTVQISGKTMNWYHTQSAGNQMNESGYTYRYLAIG